MQSKKTDFDVNDLTNEELVYLISQKTSKSFFVFCLLVAPDLFTHKTPQFHKEIIKYYLKNPQFVVGIAPRSHSKTVLTALFTLWKMCIDPNRFFTVWVGSTQTRAQAVTQMIKEILESPFLQKYFGVKITGKGIEQSEFTILGKRCAWYGDGIYGNLRGAMYLGKRPSDIICDDVENDENIRSSDQRKKMSLTNKKTILSLGGDDSQYIFIGTILHYDSLLSNLYKNNGGFFYATTPENPLWPERMGKDFLENKKRELGSLVYAQEYENIPMLDEDAIIKPSWIQKGYLQPEFGSLRVISIDPAISKKDTANNTGFLILEKTKGKIYVRDDFSAKYSVYELVEKIIKVCKFEKIDYVLVEEVAFQQAIGQVLMRESQFKNVSIPFKAIQVNKDKVIRLIQVSVHFENGNIYFKDGLNDVIDETLQFPVGDRDDRVDALSQGIKFLTDNTNTPIRTTNNTMSMNFNNRQF